MNVGKGSSLSAVRRRCAGAAQITSAAALLMLAPLLALAALGATVPLFRTLLALAAGLIVLAVALRAAQLLADGDGDGGPQPLPFRMLVADVDGTLIDADQVVSPRTKSALKAARDAGLIVALCTGRSPTAAAHFVRELELDGPHIFFDGALVAPIGRVDEVYCCAPDAGALSELASRCRAEMVPLELYDRDAHFVEQATSESDWHALLQGVKLEVRPFDEVLRERGIVKGELVADGEAARAAVARMEIEFAGRLRFSHATVPGHERYDLVNVVHPTVSKGVALRHLAAHYNVPLSQVVAIGDGANDIPLLQTAGLGVAMGDAPIAVKAAADRITAGIAEDGFSLAVEILLHR